MDEPTEEIQLSSICVYQPDFKATDVGFSPVNNHMYAIIRKDRDGDIVKTVTRYLF